MDALVLIWMLYKEENVSSHQSSNVICNTLYDTNFWTSGAGAGGIFGRPPQRERNSVLQHTNLISPTFVYFCVELGDQLDIYMKVNPID